MPALVAFDTLPQLFQRTARHFEGQNRAALSYKDRETKAWTDISWEEFALRVRSFAGFLHARGVGPGDRVAVLSENRPEWAIADLAALHLGAVGVALYPTLPADQVQYILQNSGAKWLVASTGLQVKKVEAVFDACPDLQGAVVMTPTREAREWAVLWDDALAQGAAYARDRAHVLDRLWHEVEPDDLAALIYTSGTTGLPKGVMLTHHNFVSNTQAALERIWLTDQDVHLSFLPLSHAFERVAGYFVMMAAGARIAYAESVDAVAKNLPEVRPTVMVSVPRLFERVYNAVQKTVQEGSPAKQKIFGWAVRSGQKAAQKKAKGKSAGPLLGAQARLGHKLVFSGLHEKLGGRVRLAVSGGAALPKEIGQFFQAAGVPIIEGYGLTETTPVLAVAPEQDPQYGTVGHVLPGVTVAIQDLTSGQHLAQIEGGDYGHGAETLTSAPGEILAKGPNVMKGYWNDAAATREVIDPDGWFHTGDVGRFVDGHLQITDRIKHMIVSKGGKNVYPGPIEERFKTEPLIDQMLVVGEGREFLTALVVPNEDAVRALAKTSGVDGSLEELLRADAIQKPFADAFRAYSKGAASHEKIRDFRLVAEPFSVENDLLTPTMKPKRKKIEAAYADRIDEMYGQAA